MQILLLTACTHTATYHSPGPYHGGPLLAPGTYLQDVSVEPRQGKTFRFQGVFHRGKEGVTIAGLSPFGTTIFRIQDTMQEGSGPRVEIFVPELEAHRDRVLDFYQGIRPLLLLVDHPERENGLVAKRFPDGRPSLLEAKQGLSLAIEGYDSAGRVERFRVTNTQFVTNVHLREYHGE